MDEPFNLRMERNRYTRPVSQEELALAVARELGWSRATVIDIEAGRVEVPLGARAIVLAAIRRLAEESQ